VDVKGEVSSEDARFQHDGGHAPVVFVGSERRVARESERRKIGGQADGKGRVGT